MGAGVSVLPLYTVTLTLEVPTEPTLSVAVSMNVYTPGKRLLTAVAAVFGATMVAPRDVTSDHLYEVTILPGAAVAEPKRVTLLAGAVMV
jgi:translation initiation factor 2 gamma subunit (eIF-2gamma)